MEVLGNMEKEKIIVPQIVALDFDRTLCDLDSVMTRFYDACDKCGMGAGRVKEARGIVEDDGRSFDPLGFVEKELGREKVAEIKECFIDGRGSVLYDDAISFVKRLDSNGIPHFVLTYAVNREWQEMKLKASNYGGKVIMIDGANKGGVIAGMRLDGGKFGVDMDKEGGGVFYLADSVCMVDDKLVSFDSFPDNYKGYLMVREGFKKSGQDLSGSKNIELISSFEDLEIKEHVVEKRHL